MKYIWLIILIIAYAYAWWNAFKDIKYCYRHFKRPFEHLTDWVQMFIVAHMVILICASFIEWLAAR